MECVILVQLVCGDTCVRRNAIQSAMDHVYKKVVSVESANKASLVNDAT